MKDEIMQTEIMKRTKQGWRLVSQSDQGASMVKPKKFSVGWAILWTLLFGVGLLVYLLYYMTKKEKLVYLSVVDGRVKAING